MRNHLFASASAFALLFCAHAASAQITASPTAQSNAPGAAPDAQQPAGTLPDLVVTGHRFLDQDTSGITNLPLPVEEVPQSVDIINNSFAKAADIQNVGDLAQYTTGGYWSGYVPSYGNFIYLRGFIAGYAVDGLPVGNLGDFAPEPDPAILDRYEIVKGPASVVYGAEPPGGIVNLVSKSATQDPQNYVSLLGGSWGRWRIEGQLSGPVNGDGSVRGIAVVAHEEGGGFVDHMDLNKTVLYGGLDFDLSDTVTGYTRVSYERLDNTAFNGIPVYSATKALPAVSPSFFVGGSDFSAPSQTVRLNAGLNWKPSELWSFDLKTVYEYRTIGGENAYPAYYLAPNGSFNVQEETFNHWDITDFTVAASALRYLDDIGLKGSSVSTSLRYQHYEYNIFETFGQNPPGSQPNINWGDDLISTYFNNDLVPAGSIYQQDEILDYLTGSAQAVVKVLPKVTLIGGVSYSEPWITSQAYSGTPQAYNAPWQNLNPGGQTSYRGAIVYEPVKGLNAYFSYSQSFEPNLRIGTNLAVLPPLQGDQYEVGLKYLTPEKRLLLTTALFDIHENNVPVSTGLTNLGESLYQAEGARHRGVELEATGQIIDHWQVKAGLALLDATLTANPVAPVQVGETRPWIPKVMANLFTRYDFNNGLYIGGGLRFTGSELTYNAGSAGTPPLSSYTLVDASAGYTIGRYQIQLNLKNILNARYYATSWGSFGGGLYPGEPTSYTVSVRANF
jgi:iron complex outermembrane receptor protein